MNKEKLLYITHNAFSCMIQTAKKHIQCIQCEDTNYYNKKEMIEFWEDEIKDATEAYYKIKEFVEYHKFE